MQSVIIPAIFELNSRCIIENIDNQEE